jgi:hypothetical protein
VSDPKDTIGRSIGPKPHSLSDLFEERRTRGPTIHEPTGLAKLDEYTRGGPTYGSTTFVVGAPDAAKTLLLWTIAVRYASAGVLVGFLAIDDEPDDLLSRLCQSHGFTRQQYETEDSAGITRMRTKVGHLPLLIYDARWTVDSSIRNLAAGRSARTAFFADSLQTVRCDGWSSEHGAPRMVSDAASAIRAAAVEHRMLTFATSESNRTWTGERRRGQPTSAMGAGAESRAIEFRARTMLSLMTCPDHPNLLEVGIPKNKLGMSAEPAFWLRIDRERQGLFDAEAPGMTSGSGKAGSGKAALRQEKEREVDRPAARSILDAEPNISTRSFRARMLNLTGAGSARADAARDWVTSSVETETRK